MTGISGNDLLPLPCEENPETSFYPWLVEAEAVHGRPKFPNGGHVAFKEWNKALKALDWQVLGRAREAHGWIYYVRAKAQGREARWIPERKLVLDIAKEKSRHEDEDRKKRESWEEIRRETESRAERETRMKAESERAKDEAMELAKARADEGGEFKTGSHLKVEAREGTRENGEATKKIDVFWEVDNLLSSDKGYYLKALDMDGVLHSQLDVPEEYLHSAKNEEVPTKQSSHWLNAPFEPLDKPKFPLQARVAYENEKIPGVWEVTSIGFVNSEWKYTIQEKRKHWWKPLHGSEIHTSVSGDKLVYSFD